MRYARHYFSDGRGALVATVRFTDAFGTPRTCERPVKALVLEAIFAPLIVYTLWQGLKRGWGH